MTNWSDQQKAIFEFFASGKGNLVVRARAGTGKTTTIIEATKHAAHESKVLLAAFNKRIQTELQGRITAANVEAKTLHALGFSYLRSRNKAIKVDAQVDTDRAVYVCGRGAPDDIVAAVKKLAGLLKNMAPFETDVSKVAEIAEAFDCVPGEDFEGEWTTDGVSRCAIEARDAALDRDEKGRISFDDMIFIPIAANLVRPWFSMVVVDEAQDMNYSQLLLAQRACKAGGRVVVVGDDCQAIYGFRGADADGLDRLKSELGAAELGLTTTYRCGKAIVEVAREIVEDFAAGESNPDGIVDAIGPAKLMDAARAGDFILSRKNSPLMPICLKFLKAGVRCRIEGRDVGAGLRAIILKFKAKSVPDFVKKVDSWASKATKRTARIKSDDKRIAKVAEIEDQAEMLVAMADGCSSIAEVLLRTDTLFGDDDGSKNTIVCSSVHRAKGLEADRVFIIESTVSKNHREERNIYYVAVTRAKQHLTWIR
jgi:superfamily I DNA/RNA helicase